MNPLSDVDPAELGPYQLEGRIGSGGFGVVFQAVAQDGTRVAIKLLRPEFNDDQAVRSRLSREAEALSRVEGDRTVRVLDVVVGEPHSYLVMEFVEGENLEQLVERTGGLEGPMLWFAAEGLVEALRAIQEAGIVHRDLKPSNVMYGPDGVKVLDFGISAVAEEAGLTRTGTLMGSAAWLSPEQVQGSEVSSSSDVFNLGLVLAFAATGRHAYGEGRVDAVMYRIVHSEPDLDGVEPPIRSVVEACLHSDPADRPKLAELSEFFATGGDKSLSSLISERTQPDATFVVSPSALASAVNSDEAPVAESGTTDKKRKSRKGRVLVGVLGVMALLAGGVVAADAAGVVDVGLFEGSSGGDESPSGSTPSGNTARNGESADPVAAVTTTSTTIRIAPTTTTLPPSPPAYKLLEDDEGFNYRWDPCGEPVSIVLNPLLELSQEEIRVVALFLTEQAQVLSQMTGIPVLYRGTTDKTGSSGYRDDREILLQVEREGFGSFQGDSARYAFSGLGWSWNRQRGGFKEIVNKQFAIEQGTLGIFAGELTEFSKQRLMFILGLAFGLDGLEGADMAGFGVRNNDYQYEMMWWGARPRSSFTAEWGQGDRIGMNLVGASNGCF